MSDTDTFLGLAFSKAPSNEANVAISRTRQEQDGEFAEAISYEFMLPDGNIRPYLLERLLPRLVEYLEAKGAKLPGCGRVFLSVFAGDTLYFIHARDAVRQLSEWSGLSIDELRRRYRS
ncbi:STAUR_1299 family protein [Stigmatella aurantiaca]|uniref:Uncharacterized protein n=1 Tax=Stigmatella aurantiaca (strain DW4/3-1) TaxID=378806 RepID=Q08RW9_STIAD|nr:STAUR_1299 family protein [Stigmatella aurantiaca]ADO69103.1 uncharacterized protein STAUR_1299 [Stigmatella aurantiaca DW4/3-1]EAU63239.1 hypothetical protein STIAU_8583 [Stigmatella aurantiaca DW4/3-1]